MVTDNRKVNSRIKIPPCPHCGGTIKVSKKVYTEVKIDKETGEESRKKYEHRQFKCSMCRRVVYEHFLEITKETTKEERLKTAVRAFKIVLKHFSKDRMDATDELIKLLYLLQEYTDAGWDMVGSVVDLSAVHRIMLAKDESGEYPRIMKNHMLVAIHRELKLAQTLDKIKPILKRHVKKMMALKSETKQEG